MHTILAHVDVLAVRHFKWRISFEGKRLRFILPYIVWLIFVSRTQAQYTGTTIVFVANRDSIVIAADSKASSVKPGDQPLSICKILRVDDTTFLAATGLAIIWGGQKVGWLRIIDTVRSLMKQETGPTERRFSRTMKRTLAFYSKPDMVPKFPLNKDIATVVCTGRANKCLQIIEWIVWKDKTGQIKTESMLQKFLTAETYYRGFGSSSAGLTRFIRSAPGSFVRQPLISIATQLMEQAMRIDSVNTGPPVDILCITRTGYEWIQRKQQCIEDNK